MGTRRSGADGGAARYFHRTAPPSYRDILNRNQQFVALHTVIHCCYSSSESFGCLLNPTGVGWLSWLADWSREAELFRHDLDSSADPDRQQAQNRTLADAAAHLLESYSPADFLAARQNDVTPARHVPFVELFQSLENVVCVTEFPPQVNDRGENVEVIAAGKRLTLAAGVIPTLRLLLSGQPVNLDHAAVVVGDVVKRVAKILTEEELCASLTPELSSGYTGLVTSAVH